MSFVEDTAHVNVNGTMVAVKKLALERALTILFNHGSTFYAIAQGIPPVRHDGLFELASECTNRTADWLSENCDLETLVLILLVANQVNRFSTSFSYLETMGWTSG